MNPLSADELSRLQDAADASMLDTCSILRWGGVVGDYGKTRPTFTPEPPIACGYNSTAQREVMAGTQVVLTDAVIRLNIDTELDARDRIKVQSRFGVALEASEQPTYEILGEPRRGPSGLQVYLRRVTDGSDV